jgi:hypothetical protein
VQLIHDELIELRVETAPPDPGRLN